MPRDEILISALFNVHSLIDFNGSIVIAKLMLCTVFFVLYSNNIYDVRLQKLEKNWGNNRDFLIHEHFDSCQEAMDRFITEVSENRKPNDRSNTEVSSEYNRADEKERRHNKNIIKHMILTYVLFWSFPSLISNITHNTISKIISR